MNPFASGKNGILGEFYRTDLTRMQLISGMNTFVFDTIWILGELRSTTYRSMTFLQHYSLVSPTLRKSVEHRKTEITGIWFVSNVNSFVLDTIWISGEFSKWLVKGRFWDKYMGSMDVGSTSVTWAWCGVYTVCPSESPLMFPLSVVVSVGVSVGPFLGLTKGLSGGPVRLTVLRNMWACSQDHMVSTHREIIHVHTIKIAETDCAVNKWKCAV
jgi:hypothetical protein